MYITNSGDGTADFPVEVEIEVLLVAVELPLNPELVFPDRVLLPVAVELIWCLLKATVFTVKA